MTCRKRKAVMQGPMTLFVSIALLAAGMAEAGEKATESRLDEVQRRGEQVMPFSLEQTTHIFTKTAHGGVQQVIAKENADAGQIDLIQTHLSNISRQFAQGDFSDPAKIHGDEMPGLAALRKARPGQIRIEYRKLGKGARIAYSAEDPDLIRAIHQWFDAQMSDHARHAAPGHAHDPAHTQ
jgi:hypothetical protein